MIKMIVLDDQVPGVDHHVFLVHLPPPVVFGLRHFVFQAVFSGLQSSFCPMEASQRLTSLLEPFLGVQVLIKQAAPHLVLCGPLS